MQSIIYSCAFFFIFLFSQLANAQSPWADSPLPKTDLKSKDLPELPAQFRLLTLNKTELNKALKDVSKNGDCLEIPLPGDGFECFEIQISAVMHPDLGAKYPHIQTFAGKSKNAPSSTIRFVWADDVFHAIAFTEKGVLFIDKVESGGTPFYISYFGKDLPSVQHECGTDELIEIQQDETFKKKNKAIVPNWDLPTSKSMMSPYAVGTELRTYRLAMAVTGEVTTAIGGVSATMTRVANLVSDLNAIYERDLCVRLELIPNNDTLIYDNPATDPYSNNSLGSYLGENIANLNSTIGSANFDIGHVLNPTSGGVAYVGVVCNTNWQGGATSPNDLGVIAHEMGHQMNAGHTFNYCGGAGSPDAEPGDGNTIMSYQGICGGVGHMPGGDLFHYHTDSYSEMVGYMVFSTGNLCPTKTATGHTPPTVTVPTSGFTIPILTPFRLRGTATDDGGSSPLTYLWEQNDKSYISTHPLSPLGNAPTFRSYPYSADSTRTFPELSKIINGIADQGEIIPTYNRDFNFRFMVHDNHTGMGGADYGEVMFHTDDKAGPFEIKIPNDNSTVWSAGQTRPVVWDVANTDVAPVSCAAVSILASFDGGFTYPDTLATAVSNDGSHDVVVPDTVTNTVRIKVEAADNIFFDISDDNFEIVSDTVVDFSLHISPRSQNFCSADSANFQINIFALGAFSDSVHLTLSNIPSGVTSNLPPTVGATASILLTLNNLSSLAEGHYAMPFSAANADNSVIHQDVLYLIIIGTSGNIPGNSITFDGDDYISATDIGDDYQFGKDQSFTVDFWLKTTSTASSKVIIAKKDWASTVKEGWLMYLRQGRIRWVMADGSDRVIIESR